MKFLTIRQPWASLIAVGAKTVETRPFSTKYRGPLAIHAGLARPTITSLPGFTDVTGEPVADGHDLAWLDLAKWPADGVYDTAAALVPLPLGAVVAVCDLVDVVPIVEFERADRPSIVIECPHEGDLPHQLGGLWIIGHNALTRGTPTRIEDQRPFGDFTPGRYAWLLSNVRPIEPVPMKGAQGLRDVPTDVLEMIAEADRG